MKAIEVIQEVRTRINKGTDAMTALGEVESLLTPSSKSKPAGYGGTKGTAILRALVKYGDDPHKLSEVAEEVGCSIGRVGEVKRQLALEGTTAQQAIAALDSGEAAKTATKAHGKTVRVAKEPKAAVPATKAPRTRKASKAAAASTHR